MIRSALILLGTAACFSAPAVAQSFSHTHGNSGYHSHDTTITVTHGDCCQTTHTCSHTSHSGHGSHHGHANHHGNHHTHGHRHHSGHHQSHGHHSGHSSHGSQVTRTYTRTYVHPQTTTHIYTRTVPATVTHTTYPGRHIATHSDYAPRYNVQHTDRDKPWAHHDRKWKSRTRTGYRHRH